VAYPAGASRLGSTAQALHGRRIGPGVGAADASRAPRSRPQRSQTTPLDARVLAPTRLGYSLDRSRSAVLIPPAISAPTLSSLGLLLARCAAVFEA
jgi:hypothetical protein